MGERQVKANAQTATAETGKEPWVAPVQLCAQGLLVEEAFGVSVPSGVLYYVGSKSRIDVPLGPDLRAATLAAIDRIRELSSRERPPEPLPTARGRTDRTGMESNHE